MLVLLGADPLADFPDRALAGARSTRRGVRDRGRRVPHRQHASAPTCSCRHAVGREDRHASPTSRAACSASAEGRARRHGDGRLAHRGRARAPARRRLRPRDRRRGHRRDRPRRARRSPASTPTLAAPRARRRGAAARASTATRSCSAPRLDPAHRRVVGADQARAASTPATEPAADAATAPTTTPTADADGATPSRRRRRRPRADRGRSAGARPALHAWDGDVADHGDARRATPTLCASWRAARSTTAGSRSPRPPSLAQLVARAGAARQPAATATASASRTAREVRVTSARGLARRCRVRADDAAIPVGVAYLPFNLPDGAGAATLIDARRRGHRPAGGDAAVSARSRVDPLFNDGVDLEVVLDRHRQDVVVFVLLLVLGDALHLGHAQGHRRHAEPHRPRPRRPLRRAADARRRHQAVLQGAVDPRLGRPAACSASRRTCRSCRRSSRSRSSRSAARSRSSGTRPTCRSPTCRSACCSSSRCRASASTA